MEITLTLVGNKPILLHNSRLANPLDPYTQKVKELTSKRKKTDEDLAEIMWWEARGGAYETPEGFLGLPCDNVWRSIKDAATAFKQGRNIERSLISLSDVAPLLVGGEKVYVDDHLKQGNIDTRSVKVGQSRVMRSRPIVHDWSVTHTFELLSDILDLRDLNPILERAGRIVGMGDYRPRFGTYSAIVEAK